ncbi:hypothetical protein WJX72_009481 [[Myrmecia] bisecta]|uniref:Small-subunit processome Utp12 domain-containing protein n=1 Tax=[Myrmecia] bisecta TaxID=41462 RepID=A0AAW1QS72_9CHLO
MASSKAWPLRYMLAKVQRFTEEAAAQLSSTSTTIPQALAKGLEAYRQQLTTVVFLTGSAMLPTLQGNTSLLTRLHPKIYAGDVVAFNSPLSGPADQQNVLVRRVAAVEGDEMVTDDADEQGFRIPEGHCWVLPDNEQLRHTEFARPGEHAQPGMVVGAAEAQTPAKPMVLDAGSIPRSRKRHAATVVSDGPEEADSEANISDNVQDLAAQAQTLGQRVAALQVAPQPVSARQGGAEQQPDVNKADSLAVLLKQALQSQDDSLLERCMSVSASSVVVTTVQRLEPADAVVLLDSIVKRLQAHALQGQALVGWLQAVLVHHTAYLMLSPGAQAVLTALYRDLEVRLSLQQPLLSLAGRLDLLTAQRKAMEDGKQRLSVPTPQVPIAEVTLAEPTNGSSPSSDVAESSEGASEDESVHGSEDGGDDESL